MKTFAEAKLEADRLYAEVQRTSAALNAFPRNAIGLVPQVVRMSPEYRAAKTAYDQAFAALRDFNAGYTKTYKRELAAERKARQGGV